MGVQVGKIRGGWILRAPGAVASVPGWCVGAGCMHAFPPVPPVSHCERRQWLGTTLQGRCLQLEPELEKGFFQGRKEDVEKLAEQSGKENISVVQT